MANNIEELIPVILLHLKSATEPSLRLAFLALLQTLLESEDSNKVQNGSTSFETHLILM